MKRPIRTFTVLPRLPERLHALQKLAYNMWWCWNHDAISLFRRVDADAFEAQDHSPVKLLGTLGPARVAELLDDEGFLAHMDRVEATFDAYLAAPTWFHENVLADGRWPSPGLRIAYFSAEFGLHESVPVYSGGLGALAGDHLKAASDLGLPLVGVGLMYREGYFRQYLTSDGWQQERYPENDFVNLPLIPELRRPALGGEGDGEDGEPILVSIPFPGREVRARVWRIQVGRVPLYLLDTNIPENAAEDRAITARLYGGDSDMRIRQEIILGIGGVRALEALGLPPTICHMNEGHSAFSSLERIRTYIERAGADFATAREAVAAGTLFTTHTPVPAGNDVFSPQMVEHYFGPLLHQLGIDRDTFLGLGRQNPHDHNEPFGMTVLALRLSNQANGVSALHGIVSRRMWQGVWPELPQSEVPITSITNGVHMPSWVSADMVQLFDRYLGIQWPELNSRGNLSGVKGSKGQKGQGARGSSDPSTLRPLDPSTPRGAGGVDTHVWARVERIPDAELWRTHERRRERLVSFARRRLKRQLQNRGALPAEIAVAEEALDPDALTIGFARRFATYKRGTLIFRDLGRLEKLVNDKDRPVQFIFSGKAHPRDHAGKELIAEILQFARRPEFRRRVVFLEDYEMNVARYLVQGVDVWLNNPRRPLEASGTSGMKVAINGGLNLSILDGWWDEGYEGDNGWAIGKGEEYSDLEYQDQVESRAIYDLLEQEVVPLFYTRTSDGLPRGWLHMMKRNLASLCPRFNTSRMLAEYLTVCYEPSARRFARLSADGLARARRLAAWRQQIGRTWPEVRVVAVEAEGAEPMHVGGELRVTARVNLGGLSPEDVEVQLFHGPVDNAGEIPRPQTLAMSANGAPPDGAPWAFRGGIPCRASGRYGYAVRVLPRNEDLANPFEPGLVSWG